MMKICKFFLILMIFPLMGCSSAVALPAKTTTAILLTATNSSSVANTLAPPTTIAMPTATPTSEAFRQSCEPILEHIPAEAHASGTIINANANETFVLNALNGQQQRVYETDLRYGFFSISPDGKHLAYFQYSQQSDETKWLVIKGANGQQEAKIIAKDEWVRTPKWLDNDQLVFELQPNENELAVPTVIFNPFTKQEQTLLAHSYPGLGLPDPSEPITSASGIGVLGRAVIYNPSLSLVIYRAFDKKLDEYFFALWDRKAKKTLAKIDSGKDDYGQNLSPIWSPSQNTFYFTNFSGKSPYDRHELSDWFSISATGDVKQLTHLSDSFKDTWIGNRSLSPDGHFLAFWLNTAHSDKKDGSHENLMVLNLETLKLSAYCVPKANENYLPVWSPDSQYVAISQVINLTNNFPMLMLSIQDGWLAKVAENKYPEVWWGGSSNVLPVLAAP